MRFDGRSSQSSQSIYVQMRFKSLGGCTFLLHLANSLLERLDVLFISLWAFAGVAKSLPVDGLRLSGAAPFVEFVGVQPECVDSDWLAAQSLHRAGQIHDYLEGYLRPLPVAIPIVHTG